MLSLLRTKRAREEAKAALAQDTAQRLEREEAKAALAQDLYDLRQQQVNDLAALRQKLAETPLSDLDGRNSTEDMIRRTGQSIAEVDDQIVDIKIQTGIPERSYDEQLAALEAQQASEVRNIQATLKDTPIDPAWERQALKYRLARVQQTLTDTRVKMARRGLRQEAYRKEMEEKGKPGLARLKALNKRGKVIFGKRTDDTSTAPQAVTYSGETNAGKARREKAGKEAQKNKLIGLLRSKGEPQKGGEKPTKKNKMVGLIGKKRNRDLGKENLEKEQQKITDPQAEIQGRRERKNTESRDVEAKIKEIEAATDETMSASIADLMAMANDSRIEKEAQNAAKDYLAKIEKQPKYKLSFEAAQQMVAAEAKARKGKALPFDKAKSQTGRFKLADLDNVDSPIGKGAATLKAKAFVGKFAKKPKMKVFRNFAEMKKQAPDLYQRAVDARPEGDLNDVKAAGYSFGDGEVIIFTDYIRDNAQLEAVLAHEVIGHFGIRGAVGAKGAKEFDRVMGSLYAQSDAIRTAVDARRMREDMSIAEAVEEYLADFAADIETSLVRKAWGGVKSALNRVGVKFSDDAARYVLSQSRRYVRSGKISNTFVTSEVAQRINDIESAPETGTGRFMQARTLSELGIAAGLMDNGGEVLSMANLKRILTNSKDAWDRGGTKAFSLTNFRSRENAGYSLVQTLLNGASYNAEKIRNTANEALKAYFNGQVTVGGKAVIQGVTKEQKEQTDQLLNLGRLKAMARPWEYDAKENALFSIDSYGNITRNETTIKRMQLTGRITFEQARDGFTWTEYVTTPMDAEGKEYLAEEMNKKIQAIDGIEGMKTADKDVAKHDIEQKYETLMAGDTWQKPTERRFDGIKGLTKDSVAWKNYVAARDVLDDINIQMAESVAVKRHKQELIEAAKVTETMGEVLSKDNALFLRDASIQYAESSQKSEAGKRESDLIAAMKKAMQDGKPENIEALVEFFPNQKGQIAAFLKEVDGDRAKIDAVLKAVKRIGLSYIDQNSAMAKSAESIALSYIPFVRRGLFEVRVVAVDSAGKEVDLHPDFRKQMAYRQIDGEADAAALAEKITKAFAGDKVKALTRGEGGKYVETEVTLKATARQALSSEHGSPDMDLRQFLTGLRQFDIDLNSVKMKEIITALTASGDRARNNLKMQNVPGADPDARKALSEFVNASASTIAKTIVRPDIDNLMDLSSKATRDKWGATETVEVDGQRVPKLDELKRKMEEAERDTPGSEQATVARHEYQLYAYQQAMASQKDKSGVDRSMRYYEEAKRLVDFVNEQKGFNQSDLEDSSWIGTTKAATAAAQIGGSVATGMLNLIGVMTNAPAFLATRNEKTSFGGGFGFGPSIAALSKAANDTLIKGLSTNVADQAAWYEKLSKDADLAQENGLTTDEAKFLADEIREGVAIPVQINSLTSTARGRLDNKIVNKLMGAWFAPFAQTEQASRKTVLLAAYRLAYDRYKQAGATDKDAASQAKEFAIETVNNTVGDYAATNRPEMWRGGITQFLFIYKTFPIMSVQLLKNLDRKGQIVMIGSLLALSGVQGLPFAEDIEDMIDTISAMFGFKMPSVRAEVAKSLDDIAPGLAPVVLGGAANSYLPFDLGSRTSLGNFFPGTGIFLPNANVGRELLQIAGPSASFTADTLATIGGLSQVAAYQAGVSDAPKTLEEVARKAPVTMIKAWADAYAYHQSGAIVDKRGYRLTRDVSTGELLSRALGFYPMRASSQYSGMRAAVRIANMRQEISATFYNAYVQSALRRDAIGKARVLRDVRAWNRDARGTGLEVNDFEKRAKRRVEAAKMTFRERYLKRSSRVSRRQETEIMDALQ